MGRPGITRPDVVRAYVSLMKQGREPTLCNLRLELGSGSYSTLKHHVDALAIVPMNHRFRGRCAEKSRQPRCRAAPETPRTRAVWFPESI